MNLVEELDEITVVNDEGEEFDFAVDRVFELNGKRYAVLIPIEDIDGEDEEMEEDEEADEDEEEIEESAVIFRVETDDKGEDILVDIDEDDEFNAAEQRYFELCEEDEE
ncbi:MAG: DUF1292 domain-containing protein [Chitinophagales bacterium]